MISTNNVKPGMALDLPEGLFQILDYAHVKPGKGKAFVRMKLRNLLSGAVLDRTFRADESVPQAMIDRRPHQYLYRDELGFHFMDVETYAQFHLASELVGEVANYLVENASVLIPFHDERPLFVDVPASVELRVTHAEPGVRGDRVSAATKPVDTETGLVVQVPLFVVTGDVIKVDTRTGAYITRV